jgi:hypothetical protein
MDELSVVKIAEYLTIFKLEQMGEVIRTPVQIVPLDFEKMPYQAVYILDIGLGMPVSPSVLQTALCRLFGIRDDHMIVRGENDPIEIHIDINNQEVDIKNQAMQQGVSPAPILNTDGEYPKSDQTASGDNYYGSSYNGHFLDVLRGIADAKKLERYGDAPELTTKTIDDFNNGFTIKYKPKSKEAKRISRYGNFEDEGSTVKKSYINKVGKTSTLVGNSTSLVTKEK